MASTVTASTMTVTISESITLNGKNQGGTQTLSIPSIATVSRRIIDVPASEVTLVSMGTAVSNGQYIESDVLYIRITNLDDSNSVNISLQLDSDEDNSAADLSVTHLLEAGRSFMMGTPDEAVHADDDAATIVTALTDLESIIVDPGSNAGTVEVFTAST